MSGLAGGLVLFLVLAAVGLVEPGGNPVALVVLEFLSIVAAGYISGRFSASAPLLHGGLAGLALFLVVGAVAIAGAGGPTFLELAILGFVAAVLGSVGGAIAAARRH